MRENQGSCHCKKVQWSFDLPVRAVVKCHCGNCRRMQGSDYSTWVIVPASQHSIDQGLDLITDYRGSEKSSKHFCQSCGTVVYCTNTGIFPDHVIMALGTVARATGSMHPQIQVYTPDKADWVTIHDDVPVFS
jgi:hypothetical protein